MTFNRLEPSVLEELRELDSCNVANAIETFGIRLRNTGFSDSSIQCFRGGERSMVGYAATLRIRTAEPPMEGESYFYRLDWLDYFSTIPFPRILVMEDLDVPPGLGSFIGDVHVNILKALGCISIVTNGAVRDVEAAQALGLQMFAHNLSVSHAFAHVLDFGGPIRVGGMDVRSGEILHGDRHGLQTVPFEIAPQIPSAVQRMKDEEQEIVRLSQSKDFNLEKLHSAVDALRLKRRNLKG